MRSSQSRKRVKGQLPIAGCRGSAPAGGWGKAPTRTAKRAEKSSQRRPTSAEQRSAFSAELVISRVRRRVPSAVFFDLHGISRLRARPEGFAVALWTASQPHFWKEFVSQQKAFQHGQKGACRQMPPQSAPRGNSWQEKPTQSRKRFKGGLRPVSFLPCSV